jgi:hypothetical protein
MAYIGNSPNNIQQARTAEYEFTATAGQTEFTGVDDNGLTLDLLNANQNEVYLNGSRLVSDDDFTVSGDTLTLASGAALDDIIVIKTQSEVLNAGTYTKAESDSRYVNYTGDIINGDLQVVGEVEATTFVGDGSGLTGLPTSLSDLGIENHDQVTVDGSGNVDVSGTVTADGLSSDGALLIQANAGNFTKIENDGKKVAYFQDDCDVSFYNAAGTTAKFFWDASAESLGIGTTSPSSKLTIAGGTTDSYADGIVMSKNGGNLYGIYPSLNNLEFRSVTGNTHVMTMTFGGDVIVGGVSSIESAKFSVDAGSLRNGVSVSQPAASGWTGINIDRTTSDGDVISLKRNSSDVGRIRVDIDGTTYYTQGTASNEVNNLNRNSFVFKNSGTIGAGSNWDDASLRNSILYQDAGASVSNAPNVNNGVGLYISSYGAGGVHDDATNERAGQLYFGDTRASGVYSRVRQGSAGWHEWVKLQNDFAYKEGPNAYISDYKVSWHYGGHWGSSMDATSASDGIIINETGIYIAQMAQRCSVDNAYIGLAKDGDRVSIETLSDSMWGHDHSGATGGQWSHSIFAGVLQAGWKITGGPPATYSSGVQYTTRGYAGWIIIQRIA